MKNDRMRELATAIMDGSARPAEVRALAQWVLDDADRYTDAELQALGALSITEAIEKEVHPTRRVTANLLREELKRRGVLP